ncbi:MAG: dihydrolipoyl dehydrogenase [Alcaligenaceae bacterium]|jgi:dihydrolipoamide dehydrogenase|nr:dihydrolipoyl dehydrogenase [Alcaligenaceae bacterium]
MSEIQVVVPDIGDFDTVDVIEVLVEVGDVIEAEQSLITVESDKASMEIPSSHAGKITALAVKLGDKVSEGTVLLTLEASDSAAGSEAPKTEAAPAAVSPAQSAAPAAVPAGVSAKAGEGAYDVVVLGAGPGGYSAAFRAADLGLKVALIERYSTLGGVCLNVGCIPSKALLHNVSVLEAAKTLGAAGISFAEPEVNLDKLRAAKDQVISKLTGGLAFMAKARKVDVIVGNASFKDDHHFVVDKDDGSSQEVAFHHAIIAAGSESVKLPFLPEDERVVDSTGALELRQKPEKMLVIGGGIIGLEMATVYSALGARIDVVEMMDSLFAGADKDLTKVWEKRNKHRFDNLMLKTKTVSAEAKEDGIYVSFEGDKAPSEPQRYDLVLQAVGRRPNGAKLSADKAGVHVDEQGFIPVDAQMRTNVSHIFAIGDIVGQPMLAHKAVHEAHVAAQVIAGQKSVFDARVIPSVAYTHPEIAWVGLTEEQAKVEGIKVQKGVFPWNASGRAIANGTEDGFTKLLFDAETKRILGGAIVGDHAGDLISEVCLAVEMGADIDDIGATIHPHPTLGESVGMAAEAAHGVCTDLPPVKR